MAVLLTDGVKGMGKSEEELQFSVVPQLKLAARELIYEANEVHSSEPGVREK